MTIQTAGQPENKVAKIAALNDAMRKALPQATGHNRVVVTAGIDAMIGDAKRWPGYGRRAQLLREVRQFDTFNEDNDPDGHRSLGLFDWEGTSCMWKIDYYDTDLEFGSADPADPDKTARVLTILRTDEY
ncbi:MULTISPECIES: DUF3768 domain-containing protein [unclassified Sphingobium]|uniref:DUF3768 domain-containing protein n=1 Tax=unclassified Sphingobium TaxID=2611147 RepID=UPI0022242B78|nr:MULTISPECIES: DUF3768 domain-containing protein [unclassified Sphingobium]MCW2386939.1 hypothetical protein [Sphingobium sp. B2D3D]